MIPVIITDSCSDLPLAFVEQHQLPIVNLMYHLNGQDYVDDFGKSHSFTEFYEAVRQGAMPTTSQVNVHTFVEMFRQYRDHPEGVIYIGFSSALSGTFNSAVAAREIILEENPDAKLAVIDSRSASLGLGMLVHYAVELAGQGAGYQEIVDWVENNKLKLNHWFTVEDLNHLKRGGRVSGAAAFVGSMLNVKPILNVDNEGRLIPQAKVRGRSKSLKYLKEQLDQRIVNPEEQVIFISHGDSLADAQSLKEMILADHPVKDVVIGYVGPVIGAHAGPGTIALFFMGEHR